MCCSPRLGARPEGSFHLDLERRILDIPLGWLTKVKLFFKTTELTIRHVDIRNVCIMRSFSSPEANSRRATQSNCTIMVLEECPLF